VIAAVLAWPTASSAQAQLKIIISGGFSAAYQKVLPEFERETGIKVTTTSGPSQGTSPDTIGAQLHRGVPADVVIMGKEGLVELIADGKIVAGSNVDLAQTPVGVSVRAGAPKPDISTLDAFKQTLLRAKSIAIPTSTVGIYLTTKLFPQLGIADEMASKTKISDASAVAKGDAELAIRPVSELLPVPGIELVGTIPANVQYNSVFSAAEVAGSKEPKAAKLLIAFLASKKTATAIKQSGMEPLRAR
jgi:molybdate transport system substrate-binding protein